MVSNVFDDSGFPIEDGTDIIPVTITDAPEDNFFFKILTNQLEQSYILGRITKEELIKGLSQLYEMNSGLDMAELIEEIEQAKERFYDEMMDKLLKALKALKERT